MKNDKNIGFLSNTGPDSLEKESVFCVGPSSAHRLNAIEAIIDPKAKRQEMAFRWWADDGPLLVIF